MLAKIRFLMALAIVVIIFQIADAELIEGVPLRGFGDVSYLYDNATEENFFQIHDFDFFLAKPLDSHVNFLAEIAVQPDFHQMGIEIERVYLQYVVSPWFKISAGRFHTALGYWNDTYHHGNYLQTSVTRPVMERFEDKGGLLPTHTIGLEFRGNGPVGSGNFGYIVDIGNGRGPVKDPPAYYTSYTKSKSVSAVTYYEFENGFRFGLDIY